MLSDIDIASFRMPECMHYQMFVMLMWNASVKGSLVKWYFFCANSFLLSCGLRMELFESRPC